LKSARCINDSSNYLGNFDGVYSIVPASANEDHMWFSLDGGSSFNIYSCQPLDYIGISYPVFDASHLDPVLIAGAVGTGFFILVPLWAASIGVKYLIRSINLKE
jgi:hypothetical protein